MAQCSIHRGVISAAHEVMNEASVNDDPTKPSHVLLRSAMEKVLPTGFSEN